ncbi:MAG: hypothetical protein ACRCUE_17870, partial [Bosea sp. (in: a-proteobacteria)]
MVNLTKFRITNGEIQFIRQVDAIPTTTKKEGNVTINNMGTDAVPAHFEVSFMISAEFGEGHDHVNNAFHLNCIVNNTNDSASYRAVESQAIAELGPMLRAMASKIDEHIS